MRRLLDYDPQSGVATYHSYDHNTQETTIEVVQDAAPFLERAKRFRLDTDRKRKQMKKEWVHAATIPVGVQYKWLKEYGVNIYDKTHTERVKGLLNSRDYSYLKCADLVL